MIKLQGLLIDKKSWLIYQMISTMSIIINSRPLSNQYIFRNQDYIEKVYMCG